MRLFVGLDEGGTIIRIGNRIAAREQSAALRPEDRAQLRLVVTLEGFYQRVGADLRRFKGLLRCCGHGGHEGKPGESGGQQLGKFHKASPRLYKGHDVLRCRLSEVPVGHRRRASPMGPMSATDPRSGLAYWHGRVH